MAAKIVGTALHIADTERTEQRFKKRNVAKEELVLKRLGASRDDDALARAKCGEQVSQGLPGAGPRFDDEVAAFFEGALDGLGHGQLAGTKLVGERRLRQDAAWREKFMERGQGAGCGVAGGHRDSLHHSEPGCVVGGAGKIPQRTAD